VYLLSHQPYSCSCAMFMSCYYRYGSSNNITRQSFGFSTTVSFIFKENSDFIGYKPPSPPVLFDVPHDVFYPFVQSSANSGNSRMNWIVTATSMLVSCIAVCVISGVI